MSKLGEIWAKGCMTGMVIGAVSTALGFLVGIWLNS